MSVLTREVKIDDVCGCEIVFSGRVGRELSENLGKHKVHNMSSTIHYKRWDRMKDRCFSGKSKHYSGIGVSKDWSDSFYLFYEEFEKNNPGPPYSIDRIDPYRHYCKHNVRFATKREQSQNRRVVKLRKMATGVSYDKVHKYYTAKTSHDGNEIYIGSFQSEYEASIAWVAADKMIKILTTQKSTNKL